MSAPGRKKKRFDFSKVVAPLIILAVIFAICEVIARTTGISEYIMPAPSKIFLNTCSHFFVDIWEHFLITLKVILIGFVSATVLGMLLAALIRSPAW